MDTQKEPDARDDAPLSPEQMLALSTRQQRSIEGQIAGFVPHILLVWGIAWLAGFLTLWLIDGLQPAFGIPLAVAVPIFVALILGGIALSALFGIRSGRGLRGSSADAFRGIVFGSTWLVGALCIQGLGQALIVNGMDPELANIYYPTAYVLFTGVMYFVSAALWRAVPMLILGGWTILVGIAAPYFGYPTHYLVLALAGGLGLLALAIAGYIHLARLRRALRSTEEARHD